MRHSAGTGQELRSSTEPSGLTDTQYL
uniref:Uncharacterized protein n=1 Tax=Anguilla anguilla TaxID=7936 RepID=A0A0E9VT51_ANGAN